AVLRPRASSTKSPRTVRSSCSAPITTRRGSTGRPSTSSEPTSRQPTKRRAAPDCARASPTSTASASRRGWTPSSATTPATGPLRRLRRGRDQHRDQRTDRLRRPHRLRHRRGRPVDHSHPEHRCKAILTSDPPPMEHLSIQSVKKSFGENTAIEKIDLSVREGEFLSLLGPSGCGKTTLLRMIAGFEHPTVGHIYLDGKDLVGLPPHKRPVNTVFQSY